MVRSLWPAAFITNGNLSALFALPAEDVRLDTDSDVHFVLNDEAPDRVADWTITTCHSILLWNMWAASPYKEVLAYA